MNSFLFNEADFTRLHHIYYNESEPPIPKAEQRRLIGKILAASTVSADPDTAGEHVGFGDEIILSSTTDAKDDFTLRIVTPSEADPADDKISILTPVSLAVIGRRKGSVTTWEANGITREMLIISIRKSADRQHAALAV
jgi:transcription elongation GreA/GreB family factor